MPVESPNDARKLSEGQTSRSTLKIPTVSKELYWKTREVLRDMGLTFITTIKSRSIAQLIAGDVTGLRFDYVNPSKKMRSNVPPQIEVAIDPYNPRIDGSNNLSIDDQWKKIEDQEILSKARLMKVSEGVRDSVTMLRPRHASTLAQLDFRYQNRTGRVLLVDWYGTDDETKPGNVARVGRSDHSGQLVVLDWPRASGYPSMFALRAVVLPRMGA